jgi:predicted AlkP superfamily pyrophosphatase or phosphodiesterase
MLGAWARFSFQACWQNKMPVRCGGSFLSPPFRYGIFYFALQGFPLQSLALGHIFNPPLALQ